MPKPDRHVAVDRVDWPQLILWPRLTRAFSMALAPSRLILGLAMITIFMTFGSIWDVLAGPTVPAAGLGAEPPDPDELQSTLRSMLRDPDLVNPQDGRPIAGGDRTPDTDMVRGLILENFHALSPESAPERIPDVNEALTTLDSLSNIGVFHATTRFVVNRFRDAAELLVDLDPGAAFQSIRRIPCELPGLLWETHAIFVVVMGTLIGLVGLVFGAAICRSVACEFAAGRHVTWSEALSFSLERWTTLAGAFLLPGIALAIGAALLAIIGLLLRIPVVNVLGALLYLPALLGGLLAACLIILTFLGSGLIIPAIAVDGTDAPDALARAFSYVKNRPLYLLGYCIVAAFIGALGLVLVFAVAALTINFTAWGATLIPGADDLAPHLGGASFTHLTSDAPTWHLGMTDRIAVGLIAVWRTLIAGLVAGFVVSYKMSALTIIYFLIRRATDDQDLDEVWLPDMIEGTLSVNSPTTGKAEA